MTSRPLIALCAAMAIGSCTDDEPGPSAARGEPEFQNFQGTTECRLAEHFLPETEADAQEIVRWAVARGHRVRAVSSPSSHSESDIICPGEDGVLVNFHRMDDVIAIDPDAMEVTVEPGIQMGALGQALHEEGFGLAIHIPITVVTAAGTIATGAHHSSLTMPSGIQDMVTGLRLIDGAGELVELTGDEARHASVHLGVLGGITQVTFRIRPQYKTRAGIERGSDENLCGVLREFREALARECGPGDYVRRVLFLCCSTLCVDEGFRRRSVEERRVRRANDFYESLPFGGCHGFFAPFVDRTRGKNGLELPIIIEGEGYIEWVAWAVFTQCYRAHEVTDKSDGLPRAVFRFNVKLIAFVGREDHSLRDAPRDERCCSGKSLPVVLGFGATYLLRRLA